MRVFLSVDMEGITGVCHRDHLLAGGQDYERARKWLTGDVNAAVEGALEAGATEIVVADGHATMRNVLLDELHPEARYLTGPAHARAKPLIQLGALAPGRWDAAFLVGYHSRAGTPGGLLSHTWVGALVHEIRLNGRPAGEALLNAAILGHYGIPVVLATGADDFVREVKADLGDDLETVEVKQTLGPATVVTQSPARAQAAIREAARRALGKERPPLRVDPPVVLELEVHRDPLRERGLELGGEPFGRLGIRYRAEDVPAAIEQLWRAMVNMLREDASFLR